MTDPIYPDKTKTGLAALKPLFVAFCDEPERWVWEWLDGEAWDEVPLYDAVYLFDIVNRQVRLTPKPRRVWIGDQSYPEPVVTPRMGEIYFLADIADDAAQAITYNNTVRQQRWLLKGYLFYSADDARHCIAAHHEARRTE